MIRALVFDWGGVFQRTVDYGPRQQLDAELHLPPGSVERAVFSAPLWEQASLGCCSAEEAWARIARELGYPPEGLEAFVRQFFAGDRVDPALVALVRFYRERGFPVGLLSNAPRGLSGALSAVARWGQQDLFDAQVFSYQVGALKPDRRMYEAILAALDVAACEALFVDDSLPNVEGARAVGMQAVHFVGVEPLLDALARWGLPVPPR
jgi:HAD superfamily hydrolase (TIGR01509 family)